MFDFTFPDVQLQDVMVQAISLVTTRLTEGMAHCTIPPTSISMHKQDREV